MTDWVVAKAHDDVMKENDCVSFGKAIEEAICNEVR
jgi:hypothetical protein